MAASLNFDDIPDDVRRSIGLRKQRVTTFGKQQVRQHAIRVLATVASLTQQQRSRVLQHAMKLNRV
jgi:hypothetical protein